MQTRMDYSKVAPGSVQAMYKLQKYVDASGLEHSLLELVKTRVSHINGCAFCIDMHTKNARAAGETEQRLYGLSPWRETPVDGNAVTPIDNTAPRIGLPVAHHYVRFTGRMAAVRRKQRPMRTAT